MHQQFADEYLKAPGEFDRAPMAAPIAIRPPNRVRSKIRAAVA
jgi:hypothetical protein